MVNFPDKLKKKKTMERGFYISSWLAEFLLKWLTLLGFYLFCRAHKYLFFFSLNKDIWFKKVNCYNNKHTEVIHLLLYSEASRFLMYKKEWSFKHRYTKSFMHTYITALWGFSKLKWWGHAILKTQQFLATKGLRRTACLFQRDAPCCFSFHFSRRSHLQKNQMGDLPPN